MNILFKLYKYYWSISLFVLLVVGITVYVAERYIVQHHIDNFLKEEYEDIKTTISKNYITIGDTVWGSSWFAVPHNVGFDINKKDNFTLYIDGQKKYFRKIEKSFVLNNKSVLVHLWIELNMSSFYTFLFVLFPVFIFLCILGYIALLEFIKYKSWELLNYISHLFERFNIDDESNLKLDTKDRIIVNDFNNIFKFMINHKRMSKSSSITDMGRIFQYIVGKVEQFVQQNRKIDHTIVEFVNIISDYRSK